MYRGSFAHNPEIHRMRRAAEERDPVENAFRAFVALSSADKQQMCERFNEWQRTGVRPDTLTFTRYSDDH
jgi:hypothetical protein